MPQTVMTPAALTCISELSGVGGRIPASQVGLNADQIIGSLAQNGEALLCLNIPANVDFGTEETCLWWGATKVSDGFILWGVEDVEGAVWVEGSFPSLGEAREAAEASAASINQALS